MDRRRSRGRDERLRRQAGHHLGLRGRAVGIVTVRPNVVTAEKAKAAGKVEAGKAEGELALPLVKVGERIEEAAGALPIEEARIIVAGGRGVGGEEGFKLVEEIAAELGAAVGATRAAV